MCTVSINPSSVTAVPLGSGVTPIQISVSGTVANCTSNSVRVIVDCGPNVAGSSTQATISGNTWTATLPSKCSCGSSVAITAICNDPIPCSTTLNTMLMCNCCPTVTTDPLCPPQYKTSGSALIKFVTNVMLPAAGCNPVSVQRDFGDGTLGVTKTYAGGTNAYVEIHAYAPGATYTSTVNIVSLPSCPPDVIQVSILPPPPCATSTLVAAICAVFEFLFLLNASLGVVAFVAAFFALCITLNTALPAIATGLVITALFALLLIYTICRKCSCRVLIRLLGQLLFIIGVLLAMFIAQPACVTVSLLTAIWVTFLVLLIAVVVLYAVWYQRSCCPLKICDFWRAVIQAMTIAIVAAVIFYTILAGGALPLGLFITMALIFAILNIAALQIVINQNAGNC